MQSFKPIRVDITVESAQDMDNLRDILVEAIHAGGLNSKQVELVNMLLPFFTRL